eukprot:m.21825 g.21825  ORF g.21825 m.21825 type:complete len:1518 (+) comp28230_c0_seq1:714-5267(+)
MTTITRHFICLLSLLTALVSAANLPQFSVQPTDQIVTENDVVTLGCTATENPDYQWTHNGTVVTLNNNVQQLSSSGDLTINSYTYSDAGKYVCTANNTVGLVKSQTATLSTAYLASSLTQDLASQTVVTNTPLTLTCKVDSFPPADIEFWFNDARVNFATNSRLTQTSVVMGSQLAINSVQFSDAGEYYCIAKNRRKFLQGKDAIIAVQGPAEFSTPPSPQSIPEGQTLHMACVVQANPQAVVTWEDAGGSTLSSATSPRHTVGSDNTLIITNVQKSDAGVYSCTAANIFGTKTVQAKLTVLDPFTAPTLAKSPVDQTVLVNGLVLLDCEANGNPSPDITWTKDGQKLVFSPPRVEYLASQGRLRITPALESDQGTYTCRAANSQGSQASSAILTVQVPPNITSSFYDVTLVEETSFNFTCNASGRPFPSVQWTNPSGTVIQSSQREILDFTNIKQTDSGTYTCVASNAAGQTKKSVTLTVQGKPYFILRPANVFVSTGDDVKFSCQMAGNPTPVVSWTLSNNPLPENVRFGVSSSGELEIKNVIQTDSGQYDCRGNNSFGESVASAFLSVNTVPSFQFRPLDVEVIQGQSAVFVCAAFGSPSPTFEWLSPNGTTIKAGGRVSLTPGRLTIQNIGPDDEGSYTCVASNDAGKIRSAATLTMLTVPTLISKPTNATVVADKSVTLTCSATGSNTPTITWYKVPSSGTRLLLSGLRYSVLSTGNFVLSEARKSDDGVYECEAKNKAGVASARATVTVHIKPAAVIQPSNLVINQGQTDEWVCSHTAGDPAPTFRWTRAGGLPSRFVDHKDGRLTVGSAQVDDAGRYTCTAENFVGKGLAEGTIEVHVPPVILSVGAKPTPVGGQAVLNCNATGLPSPTVSWYFSGILLPAGGRLKLTANNSLLISPVRGADEGSFQCEARNSAGRTQLTVQFLVQVAPGQPSTPSLVSLSANSVTLQWTIPSDGRSPIIGHDIDYFETATGFWVKLNATFDSNTTQTVTGLQGDTEYFFRVAAKNAVGTSPVSTSTLPITTKVGVPSAPASVVVTSVEFDNLTVSWLPPDQPNGIVLFYEIDYAPSAELNLTFPAQPIQLDANLPRSYTIFRLLSYVPYVIRVRATNSADRDLWGPQGEGKATTETSKPAAAPQNIRLNATKYRIEVVWEPPPRTHQNGPITEYLIYYRIIPSEDGVTPAPTYNEAERIPGAETSTALTSLTADTKYEVVMFVVNPAGRGPRSVPITATTQKEAPVIEPSGLGVGGLSAIIVGVVCFMLLLLLIVILIYYRNKTRKASMEITMGDIELGGNDTVGGGGEGRGSKYIADSPNIQARTVKGRYKRRKSQRKSPLMAEKEEEQTKTLVKQKEVDVDEKIEAALTIGESTAFVEHEDAVMEEKKVVAGVVNKGYDNPYEDPDESAPDFIAEKTEKGTSPVGIPVETSPNQGAKKRDEKLRKEEAARQKKEEKKRRQEEERQMKEQMKKNEKDRKKQEKETKKVDPKRFKDIDLTSQKGKQLARKLDAQSASLF